jgi:hypothetical protein
MRENQRTLNGDVHPQRLVDLELLSEPPAYGPDPLRFPQSRRLCFFPRTVPELRELSIGGGVHAP